MKDAAKHARAYVSSRTGKGITRRLRVPSSPSKKVVSPRGMAVYTKVSELISPITGTWDEPLLRSLFFGVDVSRILQIPINNHGFDDFLAWSATSHGRYTVRSGYYLQWRHQFGGFANQLALPGSSANNPVWQALWKLKIASKVKNFIWRTLHGIVPLKCILANRHIGTSGECPICHQGPEDVKHLLFQCQAARDLWSSLGMLHLVEETAHENRSGSVILETLLRSQNCTMRGLDNVGLKETVAITCWYLWWLRRRRTHNEAVPPINRCKMSILPMAANQANSFKPERASSEIK
jgi:hypothetical protein